MPSSVATSTLPHVDTRNQATVNETPVLALVLVWSSAEPHRVGEVAFPPPFAWIWLGRGDTKGEKFLRFFRHRQGEPLAENSCEGSVACPAVSRRQLKLYTTAVDIDIEVTGGCLTLVNGVEVAQGKKAVLKPGDTLHFMGEAVFLCVRRSRVLPDLGDGVEHQRFGEPDPQGIVGESPAIMQVREDLRAAARSPYHVLIRGESGSGKEMSAAAVHHQSTRARGPFVTHNAAVFTESLLEQQLFGNAASFPNPGSPARKGLFTRAERGTLFLDEIGDCPIEAQPHFLRVMETGEYEVMGEQAVRRGDIRIVGATNREDNALRPELLKRFVAQVEIPPLRQRREDIPLIVRHIVLKRAVVEPAMERFVYAGPTGRREVRLSGSFIDQLVRHPLDGNVRDLSKLLYDAVRSSKDDTIRAPSSSSNDAAPTSGAPSTERSRKPTREELADALARAGGKVRRVADAWGRSRISVYRLMKEYGIESTPDDTP